MFKIEVRNKNGKKEVFEREDLRVRDYLDYLDLLERIEPMTQLASYKEQLEFVAGLFPDLTADQLADGVSTKEMNDIFTKIIVAMNGGDTDPKQED